jgi:hypothetical protein
MPGLVRKQTEPCSTSHFRVTASIHKVRGRDVAYGLGSRGRPRTCSAMMVRCTSDVPA